MKKKMSKYLETIGITKHFMKRAKEVYNFYSDLLDDEILDIFVTDYVDGEGVRQYENFWIFTRNSVTEAKQFLTKDDFDFSPIKNLVDRWEIRKENYDFKKANDKSRMYLKVGISLNVICDFKASQQNCDYLRDIFLKHIKPNIVTHA